MPTQAYQNRQAPTRFPAITNAGETEVLATAPDPGGVADEQQGMSCNGGAALHLEVDASQAPLGDLTLRLYRRSDRASAWSLFATITVTSGTVYSDDIPGLSGWSSVRATLQSAVPDAQLAIVSAKITLLP